MTDAADESICRANIEVADLPRRLTDGATVLLAQAGDPTQKSVGLQILAAFGKSDDSAFVVSTAQSVDKTTETYEQLSPASDRSSLSVVDMTSEQQSVSAPYGDTPVVFTPDPGDIERLIIALSNLTGETPPETGDRHLLIRSLSPILEATATSLVCTALQRISGLRSDDGLCLIGFDYTAHDDETLQALTEQVDGVLWVATSESGQIEFEFEPSNRRHTRIKRTGND